jgi:hypothetical protein
LGYTDDELNSIFDRTDGCCHLCFARLAFSNYGLFGARGAWEVEHSNPRANGGTDRMNNLYAACILCNRSKGARSTRVVRGWRGFTAAPFSTAKREALRSRNALLGAVIAYLAVRYLQASPSWLWVLAGAWLGHQIEPDPQRR